ncbi:hypothetical protein [Helicobacter vulpis]|nr:hypothetical protein [Helicobacter vulpis]
MRELQSAHDIVCENFQAKVFYLRHKQGEDYMIKTMLKDRTLRPFKE